MGYVSKVWKWTERMCITPRWRHLEAEGSGGYWLLMNLNVHVHAEHQELCEFSQQPQEAGVILIYNLQMRRLRLSGEVTYMPTCIHIFVSSRPSGLSFACMISLEPQITYEGHMDYHFVFQMEKLWFKEVHGLTQGPPVSARFSLPLCYRRELVL